MSHFGQMSGAAKYFQPPLAMQRQSSHGHSAVPHNGQGQRSMTSGNKEVAIEPGRWPSSGIQQVANERFRWPCSGIKHVANERFRWPCNGSQQVANERFRWMAKGH